MGASTIARFPEHLDVMYTPKLKLFLIVALPLLLSSLVEVDLRPSADAPSFGVGKAALARSSGGRSRGGSFKRQPSGSSRPSSSNRNQPNQSTQQPPQSQRNSPAQTNGSQQFNNNRPYNDPYYNRPGNQGGTVIIPVPVPGMGTAPINSAPANSAPANTVPTTSTGATANQTSSGGVPWLVWALLLGIPTAIVFFIAYRMLRGRSGGSVLDNDTVTVSKVQVALLAQARQIQSELSALVEQYDPNTPEGLLQQLQESALALLRTPENWTHVLASSQVVNDRESAETLFNQWTIAERRKFSVESLVRVGSKVSRSAVPLDRDEAPASYIVVTLLVGSAHDQPLFGSIRTSEELQAALEKIAALPADYLMVFSLLWSPQDAADSLTYDELLTEYSDMVQL